MFRACLEACLPATCVNTEQSVTPGGDTGSSRRKSRTPTTEVVVLIVCGIWISEHFSDFLDLLFSPKCV